MLKYRVSIYEIDGPNTAAELTSPTETQVFVQTFDESNFDLNSIVLALNKRKRVRKARGKEDKA